MFNGLWSAVERLDPMVALTGGLLIFASVQVLLQYRHESQRRLERQEDDRERARRRSEEDAARHDRASQVLWAEQFRLYGLAFDLGRRDLIEAAFHDRLVPERILPSQPGLLVDAAGRLGRESSFLVGTAIGLYDDLVRQVDVLSSSVRSFAREAPAGCSPSMQLQYVKEHHSTELEPWVEAVRANAADLSALLEDAWKHAANVDKEIPLLFRSDMSSRFGQRAAARLHERNARKAAGRSPDQSGRIAAGDGSDDQGGS